MRDRAAQRAVADRRRRDGGAGGVQALRRLVSQLPADLGASVFVVVHIGPNRPSLLPHILSRAGPLPPVF